MSKTHIMCPVCWDMSNPDPAATSTICELCQQMIGRSPMRAFDEVQQHYRRLMRDPDLPAKMKDYIQFRTVDAIKSSAPETD